MKKKQEILNMFSKNMLWHFGNTAQAYGKLMHPEIDSYVFYICHKNIILGQMNDIPAQ